MTLIYSCSKMGNASKRNAPNWNRVKMRLAEVKRAKLMRAKAKRAKVARRQSERQKQYAMIIVGSLMFGAKGSFYFYSPN